MNLRSNNWTSQLKKGTNKNYLRLVALLLKFKDQLHKSFNLRENSFVLQAMTTLAPKTYLDDWDLECEQAFSSYLDILYISECLLGAFNY